VSSDNAHAEPWTVTGLTARIKQNLEQGFAHIRVEAEVSRLSKPASGHYYFTMKDSHASISAVIWRSTALRLRTRLEDGGSYIFHGHLSVYEPRGTYQMIVTAVHAVGAGALAAAFEERKRLFAARGWFAAERKQEIPALPQHIAVLTSSTAAAWEDVKKVLHTRPRYIRISLVPCLVQGEQAPDSLVAAMQRMQRAECRPDVALLVRGGGSMEDLWCFNDERVVAAVANCPIPIITGVGHEIDTTLVDYASDVRAATPSNAAELCCPSRASLRQRLPSMPRLAQGLRQRVQHLRHRWHSETRRLQEQKQRQMEQRLYLHAQSMERLHARAQQKVRQKQQIYQSVYARLQRSAPHLRVRTQRQQWQNIQQDLLRCMPDMVGKKAQYVSCYEAMRSAVWQQVQQQRQAYIGAHQALLALNPKSILQRGYSLAYDADGRMVTQAQSLRAGDVMDVHFSDGVVRTQVNEVKR